MIKVKTKSGFTCNVNENKLKDWRYISAAANATRKDGADALVDVVFMIDFLLGKEDLDRLVEHVTDKEGIADSVRIQQEFEEITTLMGEELKKSTPSPE